MKYINVGYFLKFSGESFFNKNKNKKLGRNYKAYFWS